MLRSVREEPVRFQVPMLLHLLEYFLDVRELMHSLLYFKLISVHSFPPKDIRFN
jgi:hypothetical protein